MGLVGRVAGLGSRGRAHSRGGDPFQCPPSAGGADAVFRYIVLEKPGLASAIPFLLLSHVSQIHIALKRYFVLFGEIIKKKSLSHRLIIKFST